MHILVGLKNIYAAAVKEKKRLIKIDKIDTFKHENKLAKKDEFT